MSVRFIIGKPGGGKSLTAVRFMLNELEDDNGKEVCTNLPILLGYVASYLASKGKAANVERLHLIEDDQVKAFYLHAPDRKAHTDRVENLVIEDRGKGTLFLIDEVHLFFPSRDFRQTGPTLLSYLSQHRKLGDEVILITQHPDQTDKALRRLTEEYLVSVNLSKRRLWGFRGPAGRFLVRTYFEQPNAMSKPAETISYTLQIDQASCYDTSVGVGVTSGLSDAGKVAKGLSPKYAFAAVLAVAVLLMGLLILTPKLVSKGIIFASGADKLMAVAPVVTNAPASNVSVARSSTNAAAAVPEGLQAVLLSAIVHPQAASAVQPEATPLPLQPALHPGIDAKPEFAPRPMGALANPDAVDSGRRVYVIRGFNGRVWGVRPTAGPDLRDEVARLFMEEFLSANE